jgi:hypothetical protein
VEKKTTKTVKVAFDNTPWRKVFEWLTELTGKPVITNFQPTGPLTFQGPPGKEYTIPEVIDIINEGLLPYKFQMIQRPRSFSLVPADEKINPVVLYRVRLPDLAKHGKTELVSLTLPLMGLEAGDIVPVVEGMVGPSGDVSSMTEQCRCTLIVCDTVGNLERIVKRIDDLERKAQSQ